jgi:TonB family protein
LGAASSCYRTEIHIKKIMLQQTQQPAANRELQGYRRRMMLALAILLSALIVMLVKDRAFWFGGEETQTFYEAPSAPPSTVAAASQPSTSETPASVPVAKATRHEASKHAVPQPAEGTSIVATDRGVLPPLEIEVVNGKTRRALQPSANSLKVDMQSDSATRELAPITNAVQRTNVDATLTQPSQPSYPSLGGQMKVQGSVLLQAFIGTDGMIQQLRVISGPAILSSAAREAAMQWRFKPYLQNGKPVETQARITVNFVIKVWDDEARDHESVGKSGNSAPHPGA